MDRTSVWVHGQSNRCGRTSSFQKSVSLDGGSVLRATYDSERGEMPRSAPKRKKRVFVIANAVDGDVPNSERGSYALPSRSLPGMHDDLCAPSAPGVGQSADTAHSTHAKEDVGLAAPPMHSRRRRLLGPRAPRTRVKHVRSTSVGCLPDFTDIRWPIVEDDHTVTQTKRDLPPAHTFGWREMQWISYLPMDVLPRNARYEEQSRLISRRVSSPPISIHEDRTEGLFEIAEGDFTTNALGLNLLGSAPTTPRPPRPSCPPPKLANENRARSRGDKDVTRNEITVSSSPEKTLAQIPLVDDKGNISSGITGGDTRVPTLESQNLPQVLTSSPANERGPATAPHRQPFEQHGWHMHRLPQYTFYFSHPAMNVITDVDLRILGKLEDVARYLDKTTVSKSPGWEMWLQSLEDQEASYACSWINHDLRKLSTDFPCASLGTTPSMSDEQRDMDIRYWSYVKIHPVHASLPQRAHLEANELLTWSYTSSLGPSTSSSRSAFTPEQSQTLRNMLLSAGDAKSSSTDSTERTRIVATIFLANCASMEKDAKVYAPRGAGLSGSMALALAVFLMFFAHIALQRSCQ